MLSNALKFTKSDGVITMRVRSVNSMTLDELVDMEEFSMFGKMPVWEMLNLALANHQAAIAAHDVDHPGETGDVVPDMASAAGGALSEAYSIGGAMAARIRETRKSFSRGTGPRNPPSRDRDSGSDGDSTHNSNSIHNNKEKSSSQHSNKPQSSNRIDESGHSNSKGGSSNRASTELFSSARELAASIISSARRGDVSPIGSNEHSRENSARKGPSSREGSRRGSKSEISGQNSGPRAASQRGDSPVGGRSKEGYPQLHSQPNNYIDDSNNYTRLLEAQ